MCVIKGSSGTAVAVVAAQQRKLMVGWLWMETQNVVSDRGVCLFLQRDACVFFPFWVPVLRYVCIYIFTLCARFCFFLCLWWCWHVIITAGSQSLLFGFPFRVSRFSFFRVVSCFSFFRVLFASRIFFLVFFFFVLRVYLWLLEPWVGGSLRGLYTARFIFFLELFVVTYLCMAVPFVLVKASGCLYERFFCLEFFICTCTYAFFCLSRMICTLPECGCALRFW